MDIELRNINLSFSYKQVLKNISVKFSAGKIHALCGENGAGKSSLVKILTGFTIPTSGEIFIDNRKTIFKNPNDSLKNKIACVYQHPFLCENLSVKENLKIGNYFCKDYPKTLGHINLSSPLKNLNHSEHFFVAFSAAIMRNPKILILDEPTALLSESESKLLFEFLIELKKSGTNIILITHKTEDLRFCDDIKILEEGVIDNKNNATFVKMESSENFDLDKFMNELDNSEILQCKLDARISNALRKKYNFSVGIIPANKTYLASNPNLTIEQLLTSSFKGTKKQILERTENLIKKANVKIKPYEKSYNLSGGMLQRLILERELSENPNTLILEELFQGLDALSCEQLKERLKKISTAGTKIIFVKSKQNCTPSLNLKTKRTLQK